MSIRARRNHLVLPLIAVVFCSGFQAAGAGYVVSSPDGKVSVKLVCTESRLSYSFTWNDRVVIRDCTQSLLPNASYKVLGAETQSVTKSWKTVWGQFSLVRDRCSRFTLKLNVSGIRADLIARVYNDGVGFRFTAPKQSVNARNITFASEYKTAADFKGWFPNGEREPTGPVPLGKITGKKSFRLPAVVDAGDRVFLGLLESDLYTAGKFALAKLSIQSGITRMESNSKFTGEELITPWRVILVSDQPGRLAVSTTPINLAAECKLSDTTWIETGTCLWDWRVHGYKSGDFTYGINSASYKRFIDFAARNNIPYFLIDDTWFKKVKDGELIIRPEVDLKGVMKYAQAKGVKIILYYDRKKGASLGDEALFKLYSKLGAAGIKYGFMGNNAGFTRMAVERSAKNRLLIDFHDGPCPMTGIHRTLPNFVTREYCHAQQDARRAFTPKAFLKTAMINALSGPLDQNNGAYGLNGINRGQRRKGPLKKNSYNSTVVSETARTLVIFSGLIVLPDAPEEYEKKADLFEFIRQMPGTWDESRVINSRIGEHITTARCSNDQWFVGSVINEEGGSLKIPLDFLKVDTKYDITFYEDTLESHYINNRESYRVRKGKATSADTIEARMAPGGGHCMWIRPANK